MAAGATTENIGNFAHIDTSGIIGFSLASSRLMYSMAREGYLPKWFVVVDKKYSTPKNAMIFCVIISLSGPILGREALS